jgi:aryl-alcohol dehydrogenase-like predicted oxidoreductase
VSTAILGASKVDQLHENLKSMEVQEKLSEDVMERISVALNNEPVFPAF